LYVPDSTVESAPSPLPSKTLSPKYDLPLLNLDRKFQKPLLRVFSVVMVTGELARVWNSETV
jgi:hypothetical protein